MSPPSIAPAPSPARVPPPSGWDVRPELLSPRVEVVGVVLLAVVFVAMALARVRDHPFPFYDDVGYLRLGQEVQLLGGPWKVVEALFAGTWKETNRHPLYPTLLGLLAGTDPAYHLRAQALGVGLGLLALLCVWWVIRWLMGPAVALVSMAYLALNGTLLEQSARESCEGLLVIVWAMALSNLFRAQQQPWRFAAAGVWAGLAFLTKGTGILLPLSVGVALALHRGVQSRLRAAGAMAVGFLIAASPLLVRNVRAFGSPFYNSNTRLLWNSGLDDFAETFAPDADRLLPHSLGDYLARTTPSEVLRRFGKGLVETLFHLLDGLALASPRPGGVWHILWLLLALAVVVVGVGVLWGWRREWCGTLALCHLGTVAVFLVAYNAVAGSAHYFLPVVPVLVAPAVRRWLVWAADGPHHRWRQATLAVLPLAAASSLLFDPSQHAPPPGFSEAQSWLTTHVAPGATFAIDSRTRLQPEWLLPGRRQLVTSASWQGQPVDVQRLLSYFRQAGVGPVLIDGGSRAVASGPSEPRYFFYDKVPLLADGSLPLTGWPAPLRVLYAGQERPRRWLILGLE